MREYLRGVTHELGPRPDAVGPGPLVAPSQPFALGGLLLLEDGPMQGWVTVQGDRIAGVRKTKPRGVLSLATGGVVLPGLLDMHNHPDFNVFAAWEPPEVYPNRYKWRDSVLYERVIKAPNRLMDDQLAIPGARLQYAEIRAMVGGVTAIQGRNGASDAAEPLVRNVDRFIFGSHRARTVIDLPAKVDGFGWESFAAVLKAIEDDRVDAFYIHLAEGLPDDEKSRKEFPRLKEFDALGPATIIVHGTALTPSELGEAADAGAKLVWSPQSNLRLYRKTTDIKAAFDAKLPVCLGADWLPSGSVNLLAEMKVAANEMLDQGIDVEPRMLVDMVTSTAADIAALGDNLGRLEVGRPADIAVFSRLAEDPYESVLAANARDVEMVLIGGDITYARQEWTDALAADVPAPNLRPVIAWGKRMRLDNGFRARPDEEAVPTLDDLRADLIAAFPQVGPIWA